MPINRKSLNPEPKTLTAGFRVQGLRAQAPKKEPIALAQERLGSPGAKITPRKDALVYCIQSNICIYVHRYYVHTDRQADGRTDRQTYRLTYTYVHICVYVCTCIDRCIYIYIHRQVYIYIYVHTTV